MIAIICFLINVASGIAWGYIRDVRKRREAEARQRLERERIEFEEMNRELRSLQERMIRSLSSHIHSTSTPSPPPFPPSDYTGFRQTIREIDF